MTDEHIDAWSALQTAVLSLGDNLAFIALMRDLTALRDEHERKHLGASAMNAEIKEIAYHLGYVAGLNAVLKRPAQIETGEARPTRSKKPAAGGAFIPPADNS